VSPRVRQGSVHPRLYVDACMRPLNLTVRPAAPCHDSGSCTYSPLR